jgi:hypothetical protein
MAELFPASRHIDDVIDDGYDVKLVQYLYGGWYVFKSHPAVFVAVAFLLTLVNEALSYLLPAPLSSGSLRVELFYTLPIEMGRLSLFNGVEALMLACIAIMTWQRLENRPPSLMALLKDRRLIGLVVLCAASITIVAWTPMMFMTSLSSVGGALAARISLPLVLVLSLTGIILFIYLIVSYTFSYLLLIDRRQGIWSALEGSRRVVNRRWWKIGGLTILFVFLNLETYCLLGSALDIVSPGLGFHWLCMTDMPDGQGTLILIVLTALGRAVSGCVLAVAYADIYGAPTASQ